MLDKLKQLGQNPLALVLGTAAAAAYFAPHLNAAPLRGALSGALAHSDALKTAAIGLLGATTLKSGGAEAPSAVAAPAEIEAYQPDELSYHHWMS